MLELSDGYKKLVDYLDDYEKGVLGGIQICIEELEAFLANYQEECDENTFGKITQEIAEDVIKELSIHLESQFNECAVTFVNENDYVIDEKGDVVKEI